MHTLRREIPITENTENPFPNSLEMDEVPVLQQKDTRGDFRNNKIKSINLDVRYTLKLVTISFPRPI